jgi:hypothetical protein
MLRRIFGSKKYQLTGVLRKVNEELQKLCCSPSKIRIIKSRRMRLAKQLEQMGRR